MKKEFHINWNKVVLYIRNHFYIEGKIDLIGIIYLIGIQELGKGKNRFFKREEKMNLLHIAICRILEPFGYYVFIGKDKEGWPHYLSKKKIPKGEQSFLIKKAIIRYMIEENIIDG
ncbi:hypothetical protein MADAR_102 [Blattabacterium sp. (Mastotermes darwiniensis) str. MADAR]|uniref:hypothetical protein n=1 Tax=Blattabacterium sp. (Mastotermes darwiniensis) TaxID=39768 RepID=UPI000231DF8D|nr:hypothetical protein [Blattabacterium sp. (Mastotermes darwiniensis)]AER40421.1 hypothetical protein MADAR_102 [Blattabacterium sp. (Mastotermes darwiniensis) str. MADAR]